MKGTVFNIQRFSVDDGPGIRTTVFLKGCPLRCQWCHNPESNAKHPEIMYDAQKCIGCGACAQICSNHTFVDNLHHFDRSQCKGCGKCASVCFTGAIELCGKEMTDEEVIQVVLRDRQFYSDGGGMTLSGGEPLMQAEFSRALLKLAKDNGIHTAVETSGFAAAEAIGMIAPYCDLFLYDIKLLDSKAHKEYTCGGNEPILSNLKYLNEIGKPVVLRCPVLEGINLTSEHFESVFRLADALSSVISVEFEPYHPLGVNKSQLLGKTAEYHRLEFLEREKVSSIAEKFSYLSDKPYSIH